MRPMKNVIFVVLLLLLVCSSNSSNEFEPSQALRHALSHAADELEDSLHQQFGGQLNLTSSGFKFVVWKSSGGVGEQIVSLTSAVVLALATDRVLLAHSDLIDVLQDKGVGGGGGGGDDSGRPLLPFIGTWRLPAFHVTAADAGPDQFLDLKLLHYNRDQFVVPVCHKDLRRPAVIHLVTNQNLVPLFWANQRLRARLTQLFPGGQQSVFATVARLLLTSSPPPAISRAVRVMTDDALPQLPSGVGVVGVFIPSPGHRQATTVLRREVELLAHDVVDCVDQQFATLDRKPPFFVATQFPSALQLLWRAFDSVTAFDAHPKTTRLSSQLSVVQRTLVDLLVLARCSTLIAPPSSAFARVADALMDPLRKTVIELEPTTETRQGFCKNRRPSAGPEFDLVKLESISCS